MILTSAYGWRWPLSLRTRFFGLYRKTRIFLSLFCARTVPDTVAPSRIGVPTLRSRRRRQDDSVERDVRPDLAGYQVATDDVALGDFILLAAGFDDRVHDLGTIPKLDGACRGVVKQNSL